MSINEGPRSITASSLGGLPVQLDPTARDYETIRDALIELVQSLTPEWTDFYPSDPGVVLLEAMSYVGDVLSYHLDRVQNESYLLTAQERSSVVQLLQLIGYRLSPAAAASVPVTVTTTAAGVILPAGLKVTSTPTAGSASQTFELLESIMLGPAGTYTTGDEPRLVLVHGTTVAGEGVGTSDGSASQRFTLSQYPLCFNPDGTSPLNIYVDGVKWDLGGIEGDGSNFLGNEPEDEVYIYETDSFGRVSLRFGDGVNGKLPPIGASVVADYRIGGGAQGNQVGVGTLVSVSPTIAGLASLTNPEQPSGGANAEPIEDAKKYGPLSLRALNRAVTLEDFETLTRTIPGGGVKAARAAHTDNPFEVAVYVLSDGDNPVPSGKWFPDLDSGTGLIGAVGRFLTERKPVPTRLFVEKPTVIRPYIQGTVMCLPNVLQSDVRTEIEVQLVRYFRTLTEDFGIGVPLSRLTQIVENCRGVDFCNITQFHRLPVGRFKRGYEAAFDNAVMGITDMHGQINADTYTIKWKNGIVYELHGKVTGPVLDKHGQVRRFMGDGTAYEIIEYPNTIKKNVPVERNQFTVTIQTDAGFMPRSGDEWVFTVDYQLGNIAAEPYEVVVATIYQGDRLNPDEIGFSYGGGIG